MADDLSTPAGRALSGSLLVGIGYTAYGVTLVLFRKKPKYLAVATALFAATLIADAVLIWKKAKDAEAGPGLDGNRLSPPTYRGKVLGETLNESMERVQSVGLRKELVKAPGLNDRMKILKQLSDEGSENTYVREAALAVLTRKCGVGRDRRSCVPARGWEAEVTAIFDAFQDPNSPIYVRYVRDPRGKDTYTAAEQTLKIGAADCDDMAVALNALFGSVGYSSKYRVIAAKGSGGAASHVYSLIGIPPGPPERVTKWISLDATVGGKPAGWEIPSELRTATWDFEG